MNLKNKMLILITIPILLIIMILSLISYNYSKDLLIKESEISMMHEAQKYGSDIETILSEKKAYIEIVSNNIESEERDDKKLFNYLSYLTKNVKGNLGFFIGYENGKYIDGTGWQPDASFNTKTRPWYLNAIGKNQIALSDPYIDAMNNVLIITVSKEIKKNSKGIGVLACDISIMDIQNLAKEIKIKDTGKAYIVNSKGNFVFNEKYKFEDNIETIENGKFKNLSDSILKEKKLFFEDSTIGMERFYSTYDIKGTDWTLVLYAPKDEVIKASKSLAIFMGIIGIIAIVIISIIIYLIATSVVNPIIKLTSSIESMADYDFTIMQDSPSKLYSNSKNEIGTIARALIKVKSTVKEIITNINDLANQVSSSSNYLTSTSDRSAYLSKEVSRAVDDISYGAVIQEENMKKGSEAMDIMKKSLIDNENVIERLNETTMQVFNAKEKGIYKINELIEATEESQSAAAQITNMISSTNDRADQISSVSDMIKSIADQTNLLALNAAIEAARAGESGKGFAVVAEEIRKLAEQSNSFTEEIKEIVSDLVTKTSQAVSIMNSVGEIVSNQREKVYETKEQFDLISKVIDNNYEEIERLNKSGEELENTKNTLLDIIEKLSILSSENAKLTKESSSLVQEQEKSSEVIANSSLDLSKMAQDMAQMISKFKI